MAPQPSNALAGTTPGAPTPLHDVTYIQEDTDVHLQVWDTPGQEVYRSLVKIYYRNV